jgi:uncharacterized protein involved in exopolysaccharide biosynthesis
MAPYRETFRRHRMRFSLPVIVSVLFAAWFALGSPPAYRSTASLWVDNGPVQGSSLQTMAGAAASAAVGNYDALKGPADFEQTIVKELLGTPTFDLAAAKGSSLPRYLASGTTSGFSLATLLSRPHGSPVNQAAASIATKITTTTAGPQVLQLSYTGPTPATARSVLASVIAQMKGDAPAYADDFARQEHTFFGQAATAAARAVANAQASAASYLRGHPYANPETDTIYAALLAQVRTTKRTLASASAAAHSTQGASAGEKPVLAVIDAPSLPDGPTVSPSHTALGLLGGLFAGLVISFIAVFVATPDRRRWDAELSIPRWMRVIPHAQTPTQRRRDGNRIGSSRGVA